MSTDELVILCLSIRDALDEWSQDGTLGSFTGLSGSEFPSGFCGIISEVMAIVLYNQTGMHPKQVTGLCEVGDTYYNKLNANSHKWLELNGITIDLTGDQFNSNLINVPPVLVSSTAHPLSKMMKTTKEDAYIIGVTKEASSFDVPQLRLSSKIISFLINKI
ncbi:hypothetical protein ACOZB2_24965 [Pantoea endophytica]|uniref:Uncharacterized protein n=1 Tax=Pantoea sp. BJ2 TaxID=3141322 RepID=A0AAU7TRR9_9GAMM